jgi:YHS domain-containing protein
MRNLLVLRGIAPLAVALVAAIAVMFSLQPSTAGAKSPINTIGSPGIAIKGYDPVAYFEQGGPRKGLAKFTVQHKGVNWRFSSAENKAKFEADPTKYEPAYGGYCAYGVAQGYLVKIEADAWKIRDGKLYLNYDRSVQKLWEKKPAAYIERADSKFDGLLKK